MSRRRPLAAHSPRRTRRQVTLISAAVSLTLLASLHSVVAADKAVDEAIVVAQASSDESSEADAPTERRRDRSFTRRPYVAIGAGVTRLEPESPSAALTIGENMSTGFELGLGYDITRWLSAEFHVADLGEAQIDFLGADVGDVGYQVFGLTAISYLFGTRDGFIPFATGGDGAFRRQGLSLFARFGIGGLNNDTDLSFDRDHPSHAVFGAGLEYGFRNGFALRAEVQAFDTDARYAGLSVLKRFGSVAPRQEKVATPDVAPVAPAAALPQPAAPVNQQAVGVGLPSAIYFAFDMSNLTERSRAELDRFADAMRGNKYEISLGGHTDWLGSERYNVGLSDRRAQVVENYLISRGIDSSRIKATAYGETRPATDATSDEGRALNRRTELRLR